MGVAEVAIVAGFVVVYALVSRRLETTWVTGPMVFVGVGIALGEAGLGALEFGMSEGPVRVLAEATLVLLLFTDAIRIDLAVLREERLLPVRLLLIGLPLTVVAGTLLGIGVFPSLAVWEAAVLAAVLAPTDAALGQAVVADRRVPVRIRQALNVESGLNDGLMVPVITVLVAVAAFGSDIESAGYWAEFVARQLGFGVLIGITVGYVGGRLLDEFSKRGWVDGAFRQLATLAIGVAAFAGAELLEGNGFVAAFVSGLAFGHVAREACEGAYDFAEDEGQLLALLTFLAFGAVLAGPRLGELTWQVFLFAVLALTIMRMVPVALSLVGVGLHRATVLYLGWFGPRGLASILFALFLVEEAELPGTSQLFLIVTWTVLLSVLLHGVTSVPLTRRYVADLAAMPRDADMPEEMNVPELPLRGPSEMGMGEN
jgi:NhaP-type Na+/H+ or K+/H+ antiporter